MFTLFLDFGGLLLYRHTGLYSIHASIGLLGHVVEKVQKIFRHRNTS